MTPTSLAAASVVERPQLAAPPAAATTPGSDANPNHQLRSFALNQFCRRIKVSRHIPSIDLSTFLTRTLLGPTTANLSGLTWSVSAAVGTGSVGSFGVVAVLPDLAAFESGIAKLNADSAWLAEGQKMLLEHVATAEDLMVEVIGGSIRPEGAGPVQQTIVGIAAPGKLSEASAGTIDSAALWIKHGALSTVAMLGITGPLGQLGLGASYESMAHYQAVRAAIRSDAEFGPLFARNTETFSAGSFSLGLWSLISRSTPN